MMMHKHPTRLVTCGVLGVVMAGAVAGLAACGGVVAGSAGSQQTPAATGSPGQQAALCANAGHLDRMVVSLSGVLSSTHVHQVLPGGVTIRDPAKVQAVASALCALPAMPHGVVSCPADFGGSSRFAFSAAGQGFPPVVARSTGRRSVSGLGPTRLAPAAFWTLLHKELGTGQRVNGSGGPVAP